MIKLIDYATRRQIAIIKRRDLEPWLTENGYLSHHWTMKGLVVIARNFA